MLAAANAHLASRHQSDTFTAHFEYPARVSPGPAVMVIEDVKLGKANAQLLTLHLTLWQGGIQSQKPWITPSVSKRVILAYSTHANLRTFGGLSMPTGYEVTPAAAMPEPRPDFQALKRNAADDAWEESTLPASMASMKSLQNWRFFLPRGGPLTPGVLDMWICPASGERIRQSALPYVVDSFPFNMHAYLAAPELRDVFFPPTSTPTAKNSGSSSSNGVEIDEEGQASARASLWLPTVVMNLEVKTMLPDEGAEWVAVRVTAKQIKDGRFDLEVMVRDVEGEILVLSHHVALILSIERNSKGRNSNGNARKSLL